MPWKVSLKKSVLGDLRWFGRKTGRLLLETATEYLEDDPLTETRNLRLLRPNPLAQRELRLFGKYRVLFNVDQDQAEVIIVIVGEKIGNALIVQGEEYRAHHESNPPE